MRKLRDIFDDWRYSRFLPYSLPTGHERIYFYHVRKAGGTSFNQMIMAAVAQGRGKPGNLWDSIWAAHRHRLLLNGKIFVAGERELIQQGKYFFASSHIPAHELILPPKTFTVACFRDPVQRVVSHYRMLLTQKTDGTAAFNKEGHWLGNKFDDFLRNIPREHLLNQLYMFSKQLDVDEALYNVSRCDYCFFLEYINRAAAELAAMWKLGTIPVLHSNRSRDEARISGRQLDLLQQQLEPEIQFYRLLQNGSCKMGQQ